MDPVAPTLLDLVEPCGIEPDRLGQTRTEPIPTLATFVRVMALSAAEVVVALLIGLWTWRYWVRTKPAPAGAA